MRARTTLTVTNSEPFLSHASLGHGEGTFSSSYGLDTLLMRLRGSEPGKWDYDSAAAHESGHWQQHHATSIGAFLTGIRLRQYLIFMSTFMSLDRAERQEFIGLFESGHPIIELAGDGKSLAASPYDSIQMLSAFRREWFSLQSVYVLFLDGDQLGTDWGLRPIDLAMSLVAVESSYLFIGTQKFEISREAVPDLESRISPEAEHIATPYGLALSSRTLMEAACLLDEAHVLKSDEWFGSTMRYPDSEIHELSDRLSGEKGPAELVKVFRDCVRSAGFIHYREQDLIRSLALIIDIALNPPLPPLVRTSTLLAMDEDSLEFSEYHPVGRLSRVLQNLLRIGLYRDDLGTESMSTYQDICCDASRFPRLSTYRHILDQLADELHSPIERFLPEIGSGVAATTEQWGHRLIQVPDAWALHAAWVQAKFWRHRAGLLPRWVLGDGAQHALGTAHLHVSDVDPDRNWCAPPLYIVNDEDMYSGSEVRSIFILGTAAMSWASFQFAIHGNQAVPLDDYGPAAAGIAHAGIFGTQLICYFGLDALSMKLKGDGSGR